MFMYVSSLKTVQGPKNAKNWIFGAKKRQKDSISTHLGYRYTYMIQYDTIEYNKI